jgi:3-hydroxybutyryl-CoA dehydrogenase
LTSDRVAPEQRRVSRVGVVGCGLMGSGIAEVSAKAGLDVVVLEMSEAFVAAGKAKVEGSLASAVKRGKLSDDDRDAVLGRITFTADPDALADRELVVEAVPEIEEMKLDLFRTLDKVVSSPDAVLASNTSSIPIMKIAMATERPDHVVGIHFFNPVPVLPLVELVPSLLTAAPVLDQARAFADGQLGKTVIQAQDRAGFIVNALLIPFILSAIRMYEAGHATAEDIDAGLVNGCAHPMGPLTLADLIGLDTVMAVADSMYEEFKEPLYAAPPMLLRMVDAGLLGRKSKRGFFQY